jgi:hypothetical protein
MRNKRLWATLSLCLCLGGCIADEELIQISDQYAGVPVVNYSNEDGLWRISDMPQEGRMKIGPSLSRTIVGASFGADVTFVPPTGRETASTAEQWLASIGRACVITEGTPLFREQWEFRYSCR